MHRVLERQIKHYIGNVKSEEISAQWTALLQVISDTYAHSDDDRTLLLRSLELSSKEFVEINKKLKSENEIIEKKVKDRTQELEYERTKLNEVARHMNTGAILLDGIGKVSFVNEAAMRLLSVTEAGKAVEVFTTQFNAVSVKEYIKKSLMGESTHVPEVEVFGKIFSVSFISLKSEAGIFGTLIWLYDITASKLLERAKNQFIAVASHEMRTPLAIIRGNAELLLDEEVIRKDSSLTHKIGVIMRNAIRLLGIVNDFLDVQILEWKKVPLTMELVDIVKLLKETVADFSELAAAKNISLTLTPSSALAIPALTLDKRRLQQIYINVIGNAIHYTQKGEVTISLEKRADSVKILFQDTGIGIDREDQARLFKKFEIGKVFLRSKEYGSGLGLYISGLLARLMGGDLKLEKSEVDVGSVFSLTFPLVPEVKVL